MKRLLVALALVGCGARVEAQTSVVVSPPLRTIAVSGAAEVLVAPDEVNLRFAIESRDPKLDESVKQNDARTAAVLKFLKESDIEPKDVQSDHIQIQPVFSTHSGVQTLVPQYYQVNRSFGVRLRKVPQFDTVLAGILRAGANHVLGIEFRSTELRKHRDLARQKAIRAAQEKATALAKELDVKVGKAQTISERAAPSWSSRPAYMNTQNIVQVAGRDAEPAEQNLSVGMISVTASVDVTFVLE